MCDRMENHGPYAPYGMFDFDYRVPTREVPKSNKIMKAQDGENIGSYKLTDMHLEYEIIESEGLVREVKDQYSVGRSLGYDYTTMLKTLTWKKDSTRERHRREHSEKTYESDSLTSHKKQRGRYSGITKVNVTVEGNPNDLYSEGLSKRDMYEEEKRFFGNSRTESYLSRRKFYNDKFACVVDFRTIDDDHVSGSGRKLIGTQAGVLLEIEKEATANDLSCHVFVIADGIVNIVKNKLQGVEY